MTRNALRVALFFLPALVVAGLRLAADPLFGLHESAAEAVIGALGICLGVQGVLLASSFVRQATKRRAEIVVLVAGGDDALIAMARDLLHERGLGRPNVDRPSRTVRAGRVSVQVEPLDGAARQCRVAVRAAPVLAWPPADWGPYRSLAAELARELEFRTRTAGTR